MKIEVLETRIFSASVW